MKWSQGLCAAILLDGFYLFSPRMRAKPRQDWDFPDVPSDPSSFSNALAPDWGLPSEAGRSDGATKRQPPAFTAGSWSRASVSRL
jgi:hypothetical protein